MSLSKSKCWYSNNCLHFLKRVVPLKHIYWIMKFNKITKVTSKMLQKCKKLSNVFSKSKPIKPGIFNNCHSHLCLYSFVKIAILNVCKNNL